MLQWRRIRSKKVAFKHVSNPDLIEQRAGRWPINSQRQGSKLDLGLTQRTALVLGAGGGIGCAIALALSREGVRVAIADIDRDALHESKNAVEESGGDCLALCWDISDPSVTDTRVSEIEGRFGAVDVLVNNTGGPPPTPAMGQPLDLWIENFEMMVLSVISITDRVLPTMKMKRWGRIITSTSSGIISPIPNLGISNTLRMSLVGWSKTLAREVAGEGITANVVVPGRIATKRIRALNRAKAERENRSIEEVEKESVGSIPVGRYGTPEEYGNVVTFLASDVASYITGSTVRVDGGLIPSV